MKIILFAILMTTSACYRLTKKSANNQVTNGLEEITLERALGANETELLNLYSKTTDKPPAAVRPDPDLFVRRLLRQFRPEGNTLARVIGQVEGYRLLLGGASDDFRTAPKDGYDATSVLAYFSITEKVCKSLVAPTSWEHPGWQTILSAPVGDVTTNVTNLFIQITGFPAIAPDTVVTLSNIVNVSKIQDKVTFESYVPACMAITGDAEAMLL